MRVKNLRQWKKVFLEDLKYIVIEIKDLVEQPAVIFLEGDLGSGKTSFAKAFLGDEVTSPTYSLVTEIKDAIHGDFYRLEEASELDHLELGLYLENKNFALFEWGMKYSDMLVKEIPESFSFYQLEIKESEESEQDFRHYELDEVNFLV